MNQDELLVLLQAKFRELLEEDLVLPVVEICNVILSLNPNDEHVKFRYADKLREIGRVEQAEPLLMELAKSVDQAKKWYVALSLGRLYEATGRYVYAEQQYRIAVQLNPNSTATWVYLGGLLSVQGRIQESIDILTKGLQANGDLDEIHLNLGLCLRAIGDYESAVRHLEAALQITPDYSAANTALEDIRVAQKLKSELNSTFSSCN